MPKRTQVVCLCEGEIGSTDAVFISNLLKSLKPSWIRPDSGRNPVFISPQSGRSQLIGAMPNELRACIARGGDTTLMVWADVDDEVGPDKLREMFWKPAEASGLKRAEFDTVVFVFAKNRIENWIEYLITGNTDESTEGGRVDQDVAAEAARKLAEMCRIGAKRILPPSLEWSCRNWRSLVSRMNE